MRGVSWRLKDAHVDRAIDAQQHLCVVGPWEMKATEAHSMGRCDVRYLNQNGLRQQFPATYF
jgi:hypothetical protein